MKKKNVKVKTKKEREVEISQINLLKSKIETEKVALDRYVNVLVRSAFLESCTGGAYFNELYLSTLHQGFEVLEKSKKSKKVINRLVSEFFWPVSWGKGEIGTLKSVLKYNERLVEGVKNELNYLNDKKKKEIIMDSIRQKDFWFQQASRLSKVYDTLKE